MVSFIMQYGIYIIMLTLVEIVDRLKDRNLKEVSRGCDLNYFSVLRVVKNKSESIEYRTVRKLSEYLEKNL